MESIWACENGKGSLWGIVKISKNSLGDEWEISRVGQALNIEHG